MSDDSQHEGAVMYVHFAVKPGNGVIHDITTIQMRAIPPVGSMISLANTELMIVVEHLFDIEQRSPDPCDDVTCIVEPAPKIVNDRDLWEMDEIQFPRLLAEINAVGLTEEQRQHICESMNIHRDYITELLARAEHAWELIKDSDVFRGW